MQAQGRNAQALFKRGSQLCFVTGTLALALASVLLIDRAVSGQEALDQFDQAVRHDDTPHFSSRSDTLNGLAFERPDQSEWSESAIKHWDDSAEQAVGSTLAALRIDSLDLRLAVLESADDASLRRSVGWIEGTARPGEPRNVGIAGHRDSHFRGLRHLRLGDRISLETLDGTIDYEVSELQIVGPEDNHVLALGDSPALTLVTCYPFYFVGSAPERYIVRAEPVTENIESD